MKALHRPDLFGWSCFDEARDIDFHSTAWARSDGVIVFDPLPMSEHDRAHLDRLGPLRWIVVTNSDHVRNAAALKASTGASLAGPRAESADFPLACDRWLQGGDVLVSGLETIELAGSKTPGELAFLLEGSTLLTGDLIRG